MPTYSVYYMYEEGDREFVASYSEAKEAYDKKHLLQAEVDEDPDADGVWVTVSEEP